MRHPYPSEKPYVYQLDRTICQFSTPSKKMQISRGARCALLLWLQFCLHRPSPQPPGFRTEVCCSDDCTKASVGMTSILTILPCSYPRSSEIPAGYPRHRFLSGFHQKDETRRNPHVKSPDNVLSQSLWKATRGKEGL